MLRKINLIFAFLVVSIMTGFAFGQAQKVIPSPNDPCSPNFPGTVLRPCDFTVGNATWDSGARKYVVVLDKNKIEEAYAYAMERQAQAEKSGGRKTERRSLPDWSENIKNKFQELLTNFCPKPTTETVAYAKEGGGQVDLKLNWSQQGGWGASVGFTIKF